MHPWLCLTHGVGPCSRFLMSCLRSSWTICLQVDCIIRMLRKVCIRCFLYLFILWTGFSRTGPPSSVFFSDSHNLCNLATKYTSRKVFENVFHVRSEFILPVHINAACSSKTSKLILLLIRQIARSFLVISGFQRAIRDLGTPALPFVPYHKYSQSERNTVQLQI